MKYFKIEACVVSFLLSIFTLADCQDVTPALDACRNKTSNHVDKSELLFQCLKKSYDYNLVLNSRTTVTVHFFMENIFYSTVSGVYLSGTLRLNWHDNNFKWTDNNRTSIKSRNTNGMWKPEIYVDGLANYNTDRQLFRSPLVNEQTNGYVIIRNSGLVFFAVETMLTALCPLQDLTYFPYDIQTCKIELFSPGNVTFSQTSSILDSIDQKSMYQILDANIMEGKRSPNSGGNSTVVITVKFVRYDTMPLVKIYAPNMVLCVFLLIPLWLSPGNMLRLLIPTIAFLAILYQMQCLSSMIPDKRIYSGDILMLNFYRNLTILSLVLLVHNFLSCLLWRRKSFLPAPLNRFYTKVYCIDLCKKVAVADSYLEIEKESEENSENLESLFYTWSELLRLLDIPLFLIALGVEVFSKVPDMH